MATTTINSMSVKPRCGPRGLSQNTLGTLGGLLPRADVGIVALAPTLAVGTKTEDVDLALHARVEVLVGLAPGVVGQLVEVSAPVPVLLRIPVPPLHGAQEARPIQIRRAGLEILRGPAQVIGIAIQPAEPELLLIIVFKARVEIVGAPHGRITIVIRQRPCIPTNERFSIIFW